jgi:ATP-dependent Clp protease ATP-binding subunit ClpA
MSSERTSSFGSDETIIDAEHEPRSRSTPTTEFAARDFEGPSVEGFTRIASDCLWKANRLANELNHGTVGTEHLIVAMTLVPNAAKHFTGQGLDANKSFRAAMQALTDMEHVMTGPGADRSYSIELRNILNDAHEMANGRDQDVAVVDILAALARMPSETNAARLVRGQRQATPADDARRAIQDVERAITDKFEELKKLLPPLTQPSMVDPGSPRAPKWMDSIFKR